MTTRDTVEEFWDQQVLEECHQHAERVSGRDFLSALSSFLGASGRMWAFSSGRQALEVFLREISTPSRRTVDMCSFNCPVVTDAAVRAGYEIETYDLSRPTGEMWWEQIAEGLSEHVAAVIVPHFFGVPTDFRPLKKKAEQLGVIIVEDCAHTIGGKIDNQFAGTIGDAAIFSFNYDKPISLGGGGALLINNDSIAERFQVQSMSNSLEEELQSLAQFMMFLRERRRAIPETRAQRICRKIFTKAGIRKQTPQPVAKTIGPLRAALGMWQLKRYTQILATRNKNAAVVAETANANAWFVGASVTPAWLRQKLIPNDLKRSKTIASRLQRQGLRVGRFNWNETVDEYLGLPIKPNATLLAHHGLDVPIHQKMTLEELQIIQRAFQ